MRSIFKNTLCEINLHRDGLLLGIPDRLSNCVEAGWSERSYPFGSLIPRRESNLHGGLQRFHQKYTRLTQFNLGPSVVQISPRNTLKLRLNESCVLHRVKRGRRITLTSLGRFRKASLPHTEWKSKGMYVTAPRFLPADSSYAAPGGATASPVT